MTRGPLLYSAQQDSGLDGAKAAQGLEKEIEIDMEPNEIPSSADISLPTPSDTSPSSIGMKLGQIQASSLSSVLRHNHTRTRVGTRIQTQTLQAPDAAKSG